MLEEIADSMTTGGVLAATVGFCVALLVLVMRMRDRNLRGPFMIDGGGDRVVNPDDGSALPETTALDAQPSAFRDVTVVADRPASVFKPYAPSKAPRKTD